MPIVTLIKPQKNNKRVNVYIDDKFAFGLDLQTYLKEGLKVGQEFTEKEVEEIIKRGTFQDAYDKILRFASLRPRSKKEYEDWFKKHKVHESLHEDIFKKLKHLGFLDNKKFAIWWIEQRSQFRPKSKRVLIQELRIKGIKPEIIQTVLQIASIDERKAIKKILIKKERLWRRLSGYEKKRKIYSYLAGQGYSSDVIGEVLGEMEVVD